MPTSSSALHSHAARRYGAIRARSASISRRRCSKSWSAWRPSQNPSETPKYRVSRKSVSAVIDCLPSTILLIRHGGTPIARARPFCVRPIGSMSSNNRTLPGVGLGIWPVVVDNFDTVGTSCRPDETDAPSPIDADAVLPCAVAFQSLQLAIRRYGDSLAAPWHCSASAASGVQWTECRAARRGRMLRARCARFPGREIRQSC
jgi:hypothetical protein